MHKYIIRAQTQLLVAYNTNKYTKKNYAINESYFGLFKNVIIVRFVFNEDFDETLLSSVNIS